MKYLAYIILGVVVVGCARGVSAAPDPATSPVTLVRASFLGTNQDDDIQGACAAPDGTLYIVGNMGAPMSALPGKAKPLKVGSDFAEARCGYAFVARLSADGSTILAYTELGKGIATFTSVAVNANGVYVGGYASQGLEGLPGVNGLMPKYPLTREVALIKEGKITEANGLYPKAGETVAKDPLASRPGLGRFGAPCVLRFDADLAKLTAGSYLEGWQQVWNKNRNWMLKPKAKLFPEEFYWQPTCLALTKSGEIIVSHDGGYFRLLTDDDLKLVREHPNYKDFAHKLSFNDTCDYVSRLSPDLGKRTWKTDVYSPASTNAKTVKPGWPREHYSNPRIVRIRLDSKENLYIGGWSGSATSMEPWWAPFVWKINSTDGKLIEKLYEYDPMSGGGNRMGGTVADTAVGSIALDTDDNLLVTLYADGGNTIMGWSPKAELDKRFEAPIKGNVGVKLVHWWGMIHRTDTKTREGLGGVRMGSKGRGGAGPSWAWDVVGTPDKSVLAVGRSNWEVPVTPDAWQDLDPAIPDEDPTAFLRLYSKDFDTKFATVLRCLWPYELIRVTDTRYLLVGQAVPDRLATLRDDAKPAPDAATPKTITRDTLMPFSGGRDGYFLLVDLKP